MTDLFPATLPELAERLGLSENGARYRIRQWLKAGSAEQWGDRVTDKGTLVPLYRKVNGYQLGNT